MPFDYLLIAWMKNYTSKRVFFTFFYFIEKFHDKRCQWNYKKKLNFRAQIKGWFVNLNITEFTEVNLNITEFHADNKVIIVYMSVDRGRSLRQVLRVQTEKECILGRWEF